MDGVENESVCNVYRLRLTAIRHGIDWTTIELDPASLNALLDAVDALSDLRGHLDGAPPKLVERAHQALSILDFRRR